METSAPGKLMLSGEWSVLENGVPCIVMAIDDRVNCHITENDFIILNAKDIGLEKIKGEFDGEKVFWKNLKEEQKGKISVSEKVIETTLKYLKENGIKTKNFLIETSSKISEVEIEKGKRVKVGFGSSAAAAVAMTAAVLKLHGMQIEKESVFKLACIAHYFAQGKTGSAFDVAASTFGGVIVYSRFDEKWLVGEIEQGKKITEIVEEKWKNLSITPIELPKDLQLSVGFVGYSASTKELIIKLHKEFREQHKESYDEIINSIKACTEKIIIAIKEKNRKKIIELLRENRKLLQQLSNESNANLETKELALLANIAEKNNAAGKFSGAGGGDCGIAVCFDKKTAGKIKKEWEKNNIYPIEVKIAEKGVE